MSSSREEIRCDSESISAKLRDGSYHAVTIDVSVIRTDNSAGFTETGMWVSADLPFDGDPKELAIFLLIQKLDKLSDRIDELEVKVGNL